MERNLVPVAGVAVAVSVLQVAAGPTSLASSSHVFVFLFLFSWTRRTGWTVYDFFLGFFLGFLKLIKLIVSFCHFI